MNKLLELLNGQRNGSSLKKDDVVLEHKDGFVIPGRHHKDFLNFRSDLEGMYKRHNVTNVYLIVTAGYNVLEVVDLQSGVLYTLTRTHSWYNTGCLPGEYTYDNVCINKCLINPQPFLDEWASSKFSEDPVEVFLK